MWSLDTIRAMNARAAAKARKQRLEPFLLSSADQIDEMPPFPFPNMGDESDRLDKEYERIDSLFCDASGFGSPSEPAFTAEQLRSKLRRLVEEHGEVLLAIESEGEFQVYVGVWKEKNEDHKRACRGAS